MHRDIARVRAGQRGPWACKIFLLNSPVVLKNLYLNLFSSPTKTKQEKKKKKRVLFTLWPPQGIFFGSSLHDGQIAEHSSL